MYPNQTFCLLIVQVITIKKCNKPSELADSITSNLTKVESAKYLGVTFDKNLLFDCHIQHLEKVI